MNNIEKVWGLADSFELDFSYVNDNWWQVSLPPDTVDGWYAVVLYAKTYSGSIGIWHGILYVSDGFADLHLNEEKFTFSLMPETQLKLELLPDIQLELVKQCEYHGA